MTNQGISPPLITDDEFLQFMIIRKVFKLDEKGNPYVCMSADIDFNQAVSDWKKIQSEKKKSSKQDDAFHNKTRKKNTKNTY